MIATEASLALALFGGLDYVSDDFIHVYQMCLCQGGCVAFFQQPHLANADRFASYGLVFTQTMHVAGCLLSDQATL